MAVALNYREAYEEVKTSLGKCFTDFDIDGINHECYELTNDGFVDKTDPDDYWQIVQKYDMTDDSNRCKNSE